VRRTYVAVDGDNLFTVAQRFYGNQTTESIAKIAAASGVFNAYDVQPGQILTIP
jgi:nucleoid-associated protein YgaU